jgi:hypothetical protein
MLERPSSDEYFDFYHAYVGQVPDGEIVATLADQCDRVVGEFSKVPPHLETFAYAPGKWTVREVLGHISDAERVFAYRALTIARADTTSLPGFDENEWAVHSNAGVRPLESLVAEFAAVRAATLALLGGVTPEMGRLRGSASGRPISVRAIAWILAGHAEHHHRLFQERYSPAFQSAQAG